MPRTGWCRECEKWVWVDEQGACTNGHPAESVEAVHEAVPQPVGPVLGEGEMPRELERFNWGAFWLPQIWGIVHGAWPLVGMWLLGASASLFAASAVPTEGTGVLRALVLATTVTSFIEALVRLWAGTKANRLVWNRQARLIGMPGSAVPRTPVSRYKQGQRRWAAAGAILVVGTTVALMPEVQKTWSEYGAGTAGVALGATWIVAQVAAAAWLATRKHVEEPAVPQDRV